MSSYEHELNGGPVAISREEALFDAVLCLAVVKAKCLKNPNEMHSRKTQVAAAKFRELLEKCDINPKEFEADFNNFLRHWVNHPGSSPLAIPNTNIILPS